jgi:AraC-like DNA-binding protein
MPVSSGWPLSLGGIRFFVPMFIVRQLREHPLTLGLFPQALGYYPQAAGHEMRREEHEDCLLMYITAGKGTLQVGRQAQCLTAGDLIILPRGVAHYYAADATDPWSLYWVHFDGTLLHQWLALLNLPEQVWHLHLGWQPKLIADFQSLLRVRQTGYRFDVFVHASVLLGQIISSIALLHQQARSRLAHTLDLQEVQSQMEASLYGKLDLDTLARAARLSKFHFIRKYRELTGYAPIQHFIHMKMELACRLLDMSPLSITEVALQMGYEDTHYFSRLFRRVIGLSPTAYRLLQRG